MPHVRLWTLVDSEFLAIAPVVQAVALGRCGLLVKRDLAAFAPRTAEIEIRLVICPHALAWSSCSPISRGDACLGTSRLHTDREWK